MNQSLNTAN